VSLYKRVWPRNSRAWNPAIEMDSKAKDVDMEIDQEAGGVAL
jgi:pre-rRNA-processing protein TSR1